MVNVEKELETVKTVAAPSKRPSKSPSPPPRTMVLGQHLSPLRQLHDPNVPLLERLHMPLMMETRLREVHLSMNLLGPRVTGKGHHTRGGKMPRCHLDHAMDVGPPSRRWRDKTWEMTRSQGRSMIIVSQNILRNLLPRRLVTGSPIRRSTWTISTWFCDIGSKRPEQA